MARKTFDPRASAPGTSRRATCSSWETTAPIRTTRDSVSATFPSTRWSGRRSSSSGRHHASAGSPAAATSHPEGKTLGSSDLDLDRYERRLRAQGFGRIAGADEAGRGALAGPLVAAAVILPESFDLDGVNDSKVLTPLQRDEAYARILSGALAYAWCKATPSRIDRRGLHKSNLWLLRRAVCALPLPP